MKKLAILLSFLAFAALAFYLLRPSNQTLVLYFSNYCPHCRVVEKEIKKAGINVTLCNVDSKMSGICKKVAEKINLSYVPTLVVIRNGKLQILVGSKKIVDFINSNPLSFLSPPWRS